MYEEFIRSRITQLRLAKNVSERGMSLDLGHSPSYIHSITSGKALPSMNEFLYLCDYFGITPKEFFDDGAANPLVAQSVLKQLKTLDPEQLINLAELVKGLQK